jgi:hypothetical protein
MNFSVYIKIEDFNINSQGDISFINKTLNNLKPKIN